MTGQNFVREDEDHALFYTTIAPVLSEDPSQPNRAGGCTAARGMFEQYCKEGVRPLMYDLTRLAGGEYASPFTEWAWKIYWKGINDAGGAW